MAHPRTRVGRPLRTQLDSLRTVFWYWAIAKQLKTTSAYAVEKFYFQGATGSNGKFICSGKFKNYKNGKHVPNKDVVDWFDDKFPGTRYWLEHPFWAIASPTIGLDDLYHQLSKLRPSISSLLFVTPQHKSQPLKRNYSNCSVDLLEKLDIESDWDALTVCTALIHEESIFTKNNKDKPYLDLHRLIMLRILTRAISQLPSLIPLPKLFTYLREHFLDNAKDSEWVTTLDMVNFSEHATTNRFIDTLLSELSMFKYFKNAPPACIYYAQHILSSKLNELWDMYSHGGLAKVAMQPEIGKLAIHIRRWERTQIHDNTIGEHPGLWSRPVNRGTAVRV